MWIPYSVVEIRPTEQQEDTALQAPAAGSTSAHLRLIRAGATGEALEVSSRGTVIGRNAGAAGCDLRINDTRMSRRHARIEWSAAGWHLSDLESRNGGFVDGRGFGPGSRVPLGDGAVIRLGDSLMVFRSSAAPQGACGDVGAFPGISPAAAAVRRRIGLLAATSGHVLVLGETGAGKERVARAIGNHHASRPFVTLNCAELTRELARSELFGHVKGAFSGAIQGKPGLVELATGGTLFLDEIGELSLDVQGDLLRFLEDGSYRPIGAAELRHSSARIVAATNVDLDQAVVRNHFRRDLVARLRASNAPIELPSLRARREDIVGWTRVFFEEAGETFPDEAWTAGALECMLLYPWLENLRELRGVVRAVIAENVGAPCPTEHLPPRLRLHRAGLRSGSAPPVRGGESTPPAREPGRAEIEDALRQTEGRVRAAAQRLGVERRKLYRLCKRLGVEIAHYRPSSESDDDDPDDP